MIKALDPTSNLFSTIKRDRRICEKASQGYNQQNSDRDKLNMTKNLISSTAAITNIAGKKNGER